MDKWGKEWNEKGLGSVKVTTKGMRKSLTATLESTALGGLSGWNKGSDVKLRFFLDFFYIKGIIEMEIKYIIFLYIIKGFIKEKKEKIKD